MSDKKLIGKIAKQAILTVLEEAGEQGATTYDIAGRIGTRISSLSSYVAFLKHEGKIVKSGKQVYYSNRPSNVWILRRFAKHGELLTTTRLQVPIKPKLATRAVSAPNHHHKKVITKSQLTQAIHTIVDYLTTNVI